MSVKRDGRGTLCVRKNPPNTRLSTSYHFLIPNPPSPHNYLTKQKILKRNPPSSLSSKFQKKKKIYFFSIPLYKSSPPFRLSPSIHPSIHCIPFIHPYIHFPSLFLTHSHTLGTKFPYLLFAPFLPPPWLKIKKRGIIPIPSPPYFPYLSAPPTSHLLVHLSHFLFLECLINSPSWLSASSSSSFASPNYINHLPFIFPFTANLISLRVDTHLLPSFHLNPSK